MKCPLLPFDFFRKSLAQDNLELSLSTSTVDVLTGQYACEITLTDDIGAKTVYQLDFQVDCPNPQGETHPHSGILSDVQIVAPTA